MFPLYSQVQITETLRGEGDNVIIGDPIVGEVREFHKYRAALNLPTLYTVFCEDGFHFVEEQYVSDGGLS